MHEVDKLPGEQLVTLEGHVEVDNVASLAGHHVRAAQHLFHPACQRFRVLLVEPLRRLGQLIGAALARREHRNRLRRFALERGIRIPRLLQFGHVIRFLLRRRRELRLLRRPHAWLPCMLEQPGLHAEHDGGDVLRFEPTVFDEPKVPAVDLLAVLPLSDGVVVTVEEGIHDVHLLKGSNGVLVLVGDILESHGLVGGIEHLPPFEQRLYQGCLKLLRVTSTRSHPDGWRLFSGHVQLRIGCGWIGCGWLCSCRVQLRKGCAWLGWWRG
mmetsp:Transcript_4652/g.10113  ORF Transcript_4652/g.10113 Transcript_4652/m.10113 type:complete len:269 (-) Transcript_4652:109-915(-)